MTAQEGAMNHAPTKYTLEDFQTAIRAEEDPAALQAKLKAMIQETHPAPAFKDGEAMPFYEFERRFKKAFCDNVEPRYAQWPVAIRYQTEITRNGILTGLYVFFGYTPSLSPPCQGGDEEGVAPCQGGDEEGVTTEDARDASFAKSFGASPEAPAKGDRAPDSFTGDRPVAPTTGDEKAKDGNAL